MENNNKTTFKELLKKMACTKSFWRICIALVLLLVIVISVVVELRVKENNKVDDVTTSVTETSDDITSIDIPETSTPNDTQSKPNANMSHLSDLEVKDEVVSETVEEDVVEEVEVESADDVVDIPEDEVIEDDTYYEEVTEEVIEPEYEEVYDDYVSEDYMSDLEMLACVIYQEAGGDAACDDCRRRVADVVLNRVVDSRFPDTIYGVLTAEAQYGRFHWTGIVWPDRASYAGEAHAVERAYRIAEEVLNGVHSDLYGKGYVFQAEFIQSNDYIYCCGHYFCR